MKRLMQGARTLTIALAVGLVCAAPLTTLAAPGVADVERALQRGDYPGAENMLSEVIAAHPSSARAHYLYAQVLDRDGKPAEARDEIARARALEPSLSFADPTRFRQIEAQINADAERASRAGSASQRSRAVDASPSARTPTATRGGLGAGGIVGVLLVLALVAGVLVWSVRRSRGRQARDVEATRLSELQRATALLDQLRAVKLDVKLSSAAQRDGWLAEAQQIEQSLSEIIEQLSNGPDRARAPAQSPAFRLEDLARQVERLAALAAGRPDPGVGGAASSGASGSVYADEASRFGHGGQPGGGAPYPPQYPPQAGPVVVQQPGSGLGGGLMAGVLIGEMMSQFGHHRDSGRGDASAGSFGSGNELGPGMGPLGPGNAWHDDGNAPNDSGFDLGSGGNDWGGGSDSVDVGSSGGGDDWNS